MNPPSNTTRQPACRTQQRFARAQLSLVEHAFCPLDPALSLKPGAVHVVHYHFSDVHRNRKTATASVACPFGLSANDELYLYGLLAIHLAQPEPGLDFYATPHFCLRQLGIVDPGAQQGKRYAVFRQAIRRLSGVVYQNDNFYDPVRGEHRDLAFGLLKYSLPLDPQSSRAWHFVWDPLFFRFCESIKGSFQFDLQLYRQLDYATRRLFLLLQKVFWRRDRSPVFELRHLAVDVLGFADSVPTKILKVKIARCAERLLLAGVIRLPTGVDTLSALFTKRVKGVYEVRFHRGPYFTSKPPQATRSTVQDSPLFDPLCKIGFDVATIERIIKRYKHSLVQQWADITLAAVERKMIKKTPQSYFMHYIEEAAEGRTTPPDWWHQVRREEHERRKLEQDAAPHMSADERFETYLREEAHEAFQSVMDRVFRGLCEAGQSEAQARENARYTARMHLRQQFRQQHPQHDPERMTRLADLL